MLVRAMLDATTAGKVLTEWLRAKCDSKKGTAKLSGAA
jgi:hypothetical protein